MVRIIDGMNFFMRAFYVFDIKMKLRSKSGVASGLEFGVTRMLNKYKKDHIVFAWEGGNTGAVSTESRIDMREKNRSLGFTRERSQNLINILKQIYDWVEIPGYTADQAIFSLSEQTSTQYPELQQVIVSNDKDLWQALKPKVCCERGGKEGSQFVTFESFCDTYFPLLPIQWPAFRTWAGDPSDGIPGCEGIGSSRALKLATISNEDVVALNLPKIYLTPVIKEYITSGKYMWAYNLLCLKSGLSFALERGSLNPAPMMDFLRVLSSKEELYVADTRTV